MDNQEAIRLMRNLPTMCEFTDAYGEPIDSDAYYEAVDMAISALQALDEIYAFIMKSEASETTDGVLEIFDAFQAQENLQPTCNQLATDTISRQKAIDALRESRLARNPVYMTTAMQVIEKLPSAQPEPCKDAVSMADVVDMLEMFPFTEYSEYETAREVVKRLPSAQPEIVRCKDCKYWIAHDKRCVYLNHGFAPNMWCCHGERRTDEADANT